MSQEQTFEPDQRQALADAATRAWAALQEQPLTAQQRACLDVATRQTDRLWVLLHASSLQPPTTNHEQPSPVIPNRDGQWYRLALSAYDLLLNEYAYAHLATSRALACTADRAAIHEWLGPDDERPTIGERLGITDTDASNAVAWLSTLVDAAQDAGVFGVARHRIHVTAASERHDGPAGLVRLVVDQPHGPALASAPITLDQLVDGDAPRVDVVVRALGRIADEVTRMFRAHQSAVWHHPPPRPDTDRAGRRGFPALLVEPTAPRAARADASQHDQPGPRRSR